MNENELDDAARAIDDDIDTQFGDLDINIGKRSAADFVRERARDIRAEAKKHVAVMKKAQRDLMPKKRKRRRA